MKTAVILSNNEVTFDLQQHGNFRIGQILNSRLAVPLLLTQMCHTELFIYM